MPNVYKYTLIINKRTKPLLNKTTVNRCLLFFYKYFKNNCKKVLFIQILVVYLCQQ